MEKVYKPASSEEIRTEEVKNVQTKQILSSLGNFGGTIILSEILQGNDGDELICLKFLPDIPNAPVINIVEEEPVLIITSPNNQRLPKVFALRDNFPLGLSHTNVSKNERPVSLCIFEENFEELKHKWSGSYFLQSIKGWLELTARDQLHRDDQPLEPFVIGSKGIIVNSGRPFIKEQSNGFYVTTESRLGTPMHKLFITTSPVDNGVVHLKVDNFHALHQLFISKDIDLLRLIRPKIIDLVNKGLKGQLIGDFWKGIIFLIAEIPIKRDAGSMESTVAGFKINVALGELSKLFGRAILGVGRTIEIEENLSEDILKTIDIEILNPHLNLNSTLAKKFSGIDPKNSESKISLIGLGAIGSQFFMNLARSGFGTWNLIDKDILLPHNFIRHASTNIENHLTEYKAMAISEQANKLLNDPCFSNPFAKSIYDMDKTILQDSDVIIDMSTSIGVERYLSNEYEEVRKLSCFLNPLGTDFVMLMEDPEGKYPLDLLEMQYYKELVNNNELHNHLNFEQEGKIRYARGCRDITSKIPQENLAIFSGIAARNFKEKINCNQPAIDIWRITNSCSVSRNNFKVDEWSRKTINGWKVFFNQNVLDTISAFREARLPNETGGILIGAVDNFYKKIFIAHTVLAPEDSVERPTLFIRGIKGIGEILQQLEESTNANLRYLGEWHSHPENCRLDMSKNDKLQFAELLNEAKLNGQPALMAIFGDDKKFSLYLDNCEI